MAGGGGNAGGGAWVVVVDVMVEADDGQACANASTAGGGGNASVGPSGVVVLVKADNGLAWSKALTSLCFDAHYKHCPQLLIAGNTESSRLRHPQD